MATFSVYILYKKNLLSVNLKSIENLKSDDEKNLPKIVGNNNTIHLTPSEFQNKIVYDVDRFDEYHQHSLNQSKISFWFSLIFASLGFMIITTSMLAFSKESEYIGLIAGTIIETVSVLFFYQSNKARQMMSEFFDKLRSDRKLEESLKLCESIDNDHMRNSVKVKLSLYFSGLDDSHNLASEVIQLSNHKGKTILKEEKNSGIADDEHNKTEQQKSVSPAEI